MGAINLKVAQSEMIIEVIVGLPIKANCLKKMRFAETIDKQLPPIRSNGKRYSHGKTLYIFFFHLLCRSSVICKAVDWVCNTVCLRVLYPDIKSEYLNVDRLEDSLDANNQAEDIALIVDDVIILHFSYFLDDK